MKAILSPVATKKKPASTINGRPAEVTVNQLYQNIPKRIFYHVEEGNFWAREREDLFHALFDQEYEINAKCQIRAIHPFTRKRGGTKWGLDINGK